MAIRRVWIMLLAPGVGVFAASWAETPKFRSLFWPEHRESFPVSVCPICEPGLEPAGMLGTGCRNTRAQCPPPGRCHGAETSLQITDIKHSAVNKET